MSPLPNTCRHISACGVRFPALIRLLSLILIVAIPSNAQGLRFESIGLEQGLSNGIVTSIMQDNDGFMWFGTSDGLNRFDGNRFKVFTNIPGDSTSLSTYYIQSLFKDSKGRLWAGTTHGLNLYDSRAGTFIRIPLDLTELGNKPVSVMAIHEDRHHNLWIGTEGLIRITFSDSGSTTVSRAVTFFETQGLVVSIREESSGTFWLGTFNDGLAQFDPQAGKVIQRYRHSRDPLSLAGDQIRSVFIDGKQRIWIGIEGSGLDLLNRGESGTANSFTHFQHEKNNPHSLNHNSISALLEDSKSRIWIATDGGGLDMFDEETGGFLHSTHNAEDPSSLTGNRVVCLYEDNAGTLWCGTWGNGINKYSAARYKFQNPPAIQKMLAGMGNKFVLSFLKAADGTLYAGTHGGGLYEYHPGSGRIMNHRNDLNHRNTISNNIVWSITEDQRGAIWTATYGGLNRFDPHTGTWTRLQHKEGDQKTIASDLATSVVSRDSSIWFTNEKSIGTVHIYTGAVDNIVLTKEAGIGTLVGMFWDNKGRCWNGPYGLYRFNPQTRTTSLVWDPHHDTSLSAIPILNSFTQSASGDLWAGSFNMGAFRFDSSGVYKGHVTMDDGLASNIVYAVVEDKKHNLWMSTSKGISKFTPSSRTVRNYDSRDGLQNTEFNRGAFFRDESGMIFFGGVSGIDAFHPEDIRESSFTSRIVLTAFTRLDHPVVFGEPIESVREIILPYNENTFSFEFSALDFVDPSRNKYAYMLEGVDPHWVLSNSIRHARYTNVSPGEYLFRVKSSNSDGMWSDNFVPVKIIIPPPFWQQAWFILLAIVSVGAAIVAVVRYLSTRKLKARLRALEVQQQLQRERERISRDLHDNVGAQLVSIISGLDLIGRYSTQHDGRSERLVNSLRDDARTSMSLLRETIWALKSDGMALHQFAEHVESYARKQLLFHEGLSLTIQAPAESTVVLSPIQVLNCFRILQEALTNSIKHSGATTITITTEAPDGVLNLTLSDNGKGFDGASVDGMSGNGIQNMHLRAEELGGTLSIGNTPVSGTEVKLNIPLGRN